MAKLGIDTLLGLPITQGQAGGLYSITDHETTPVMAGDTLTVTIGTVMGGYPEAVIHAHVDHRLNRIDGITVILHAHITSTNAARVNKLVTGVWMPRVEKYHRTQRISVRTKGKAFDLPLRLTANLQANGFWLNATPVPLNINAGVAPIIAPVAPTPTPTVAPVATPTLPPAPVAPAPIIATPVQVVTPVVTPTPVIAPVAAPLIVAPKSDPDERIEYPTRATTERIITPDRDVLETAYQWFRSGTPIVVSLTGPAGTGKTSLVADLCADKGMGLFTFHGPAASSFSDFTGMTVLRSDGNGGTETDFVMSPFMEVIRRDGPYAGQDIAVLLDEINRADNSAALSVLLSLWSEGKVFIPELRKTIHVSPNIMWFATENRGSQYNSTFELDAALRDRMKMTIRLQNLSEKAEIDLLVKRTGCNVGQATTIVGMAKVIRDIADRGEIRTSIGTRRTLDAAGAVMKGMTIRRAVEYCWANGYLDEGGSEGERGIIITAINSTLGAA